jgi:hypothetical protein
MLLRVTFIRRSVDTVLENIKGPLFSSIRKKIQAVNLDSRPDLIPDSPLETKNSNLGSSVTALVPLRSQLKHAFEQSKIQFGCIADTKKLILGVSVKAPMR